VAVLVVSTVDDALWEGAVNVKVPDWVCTKVLDNDADELIVTVDGIEVDRVGEASSECEWVSENDTNTVAEEVRDSEGVLWKPARFVVTLQDAVRSSLKVCDDETGEDTVVDTFRETVSDSDPLLVAIIDNERVTVAEVVPDTLRLAMVERVRLFDVVRPSDLVLVLVCRRFRVWVSCTVHVPVREREAVRALVNRVREADAVTTDVLECETVL